MSSDVKSVLRRVMNEEVHGDGLGTEPHRSVRKGGERREAECECGWGWICNGESGGECWSP